MRNQAKELQFSIRDTYTVTEWWVNDSTSVIFLEGFLQLDTALSFILGCEWCQSRQSNMHWQEKLIIHTCFLFRVINISQGWIIWKCHWWSHLAVLTNIQKIFSGLHKVLIIKMWRKFHKIWWARSCSPYTKIVSHWNVCRHGQCEQELCENAKRRNSASLNCLHMPRTTSMFILLSELLFTLLTSSVHSFHKVA